jgi:hypothetical protein
MIKCNRRALIFSQLRHERRHFGVQRGHFMPSADGEVLISQSLLKKAPADIGAFLLAP